MKLSLLFILILIFCADNYSSAQHHRFRHLSVDDGLTHNGIYCITQDEKGFIWIGTEAGLNRYDGFNIKTYRYDEKNENSISSEDINCILAYKNNLYIGTHTGGLNRLQLDKNKIVRYDSDKNGNGKITSDYIQSIVLSPDNKIYVGTYDQGINIIDPETGKISYLRNDSLHPNVIASNLIKSMTFDQNGDLWMSHPRTGVSRYNFASKKFILYTDTTSSIGKLNNLATRSVLCDKQNRVWISTWSGGLNIYDIKLEKMFSNSTTKADPYFKDWLTDKSNAVKKHLNPEEGKKYEILNPMRMIFGMTEDDYGNIWFANVEMGLVSYNPETGKYRNFQYNATDPSSLCDNNLLSVFVDKSGLVWSGSLSAGLNIFNPYTDRFGFYKADPESESGLPVNQIWATHTGKKSGKIFIALTGYVYEYDPAENKFTNYVVDKNGKSLLHPQSLCQSLYEDHLGDLWISINGSGVYRYYAEKKTLQNYNLKKSEGGLSHHTINTISEDGQGNMWLGCSQYGIMKYDREKNEFIPYYHMIPDSGQVSGFTILQLVTDKNDHLWIATDSGISILNTKTNEFKYLFDHNSNLSHNSVYSLYNDRNKYMYIGTLKGLCRYDFSTGKITDLSARYNFADKGVAGITIDQRGNIWLQPEKCLMRVDGKTFQTRIYDYSDGLQSNEFPINIVRTLPDGEIIIGGNKGLNIFHPDALITNEISPGVAITNFLLRNEPLQFDTDITFLDNIELSYDHYFFTIELAALDYTNISKNRFKYKLEGFNDEWVDIGNNKQITFVNLAPGEYTLYVLACNNDGVWSKHPAKLKITIIPPFWQTTWFYFLCGAVIVLIIYGYIKYREKKLQKEKSVLEEKVNLRTSELREEKEKVEEAHKEIRDSINYAKQLQEAILPPEKMIGGHLKEYFILYKPKDIVAGDFYWAERVNDYFFIAAADCTGHGVPGAMVSVVCSNALNRTVKEFGITDTGKILDKTTDLVLETFEKSDKDVKDGMDISILGIHLKTGEMTWSGANNPLWYIENNEQKETKANLPAATPVLQSSDGKYRLIEVKADKQPIGKNDFRKPFTTHTLPASISSLFLFTDGYADQFGGEKGKKFKYKPFMDLLFGLKNLALSEQKIKLDQVIEKWKGELEQNDDICIIGIKK